MTENADRTSRTRRTRRVRRGSTVAALVALAVSATAVTAGAHLVPGTPGDDVHIGPDRDSADNPFIQPPGTSAKLDMNDTDVLFGRDGDDLLVGRLGSDTLVAGRGSDILIGGPDGGGRPRNDVVLGDQGPDIATYSPGDGNDAYVGDKGFDTMVIGFLAARADGRPRLDTYRGHRIPRVRVAGAPRLSCQLVEPPAQEHLGAQFLVRLLVNGSPVGSVRLKDVERLVCPSARAGTAKVANLTAASPRLRSVPLSEVTGPLGAILR